jgi:RNA polymerase sigma-70 factor (ECF subfamily)
MTETNMVSVAPGDGRDGARHLVDRLRHEDSAAVDELVERYGARAYRIALGVTRNAARAEAIVRDALASAIEHIDIFRDDAALDAWLARSVTSAACETARRTDPRRSDISVDALLPCFHEEGHHAKVDDWSERLHESAFRDRVGLALDAAIDELAPEYRAIVTLRDIEGLTIAEAATSIGISVANAKARLHRARLFLRKRLDALMTAAA